MKLKQKESEIQAVICEWLKINNIPFWRNNNVPIFDATNKAFRRMPKYAMKGISDLFILLDKCTIACEVKSEIGRQSVDQYEFECIWTNTNANRYYVIVRSLNELIEYLKELEAK